MSLAGYLRRMHTTTLRPLVTAPGPFTSVYFDDSHHTEDAEKQLELKLRAVREQLAAQNAPPGALAAIEAAVRETAAPAGRGGRAVVAAGDTVVVNERLTEGPAVPVARVSDLPYLLPLIRYGEPALRHVVAAVDRVEATVKAFDEHGREIESGTVRGREHPVHQVGGGGTAHYEMREHVEETVRRNVSEMADTVAKVAQRSGAELVVIVGEVQVRNAVHSELPKAVQPITHEATHESAVSQLVEGARQRRLAELDERFHAELGRQRGLAAEGLEGVTTALREANVEVLFVSDPGDTTVFTGDEPALIAVTEPELAAMGVDQRREHRADEAIPLAAIAGDAELVALNEKLANGIGAVLRHD